VNSWHSHAHARTHTRTHTHTQAEAVSELLQARTPGAADSALAGLAGGVGAAVKQLRMQVCGVWVIVCGCLVQL